MRSRRSSAASLRRLASATRTYATSRRVAADAATGVLRAEALEQFDRVRERLAPIAPRARHVDRRDAVLADEIHARTLRDEIEDHLVVAARGRVVDRRVATGARVVDLLAR